MLGKCESHQWSDEDGNPVGGATFGTGFAISWQNGPLGAPNGAFVETIIAAAADRIQFYQDSRFNCEENARALNHLKEALAILNSRTARRETQGVEGTHAGT